MPHRQCGYRTGEAAIAGDHIEFIVVDEFEDDFVEVEAVALREIARLVAKGGQFGG